jgi:Cu/Ag efflux protein CusF
MRFASLRLAVSWLTGPRSVGTLAAAVAASLAVVAFYSVTAAAQEATASGEVRRVNLQEGKVTIKHGAISGLELPAMTLVYLADPALLKDIQPGDRVKFTVKREAGQYVLTEISK